MKPRASFIVSYDITHDRIRLRIEKILKDAGLTRIQYSVFRGDLPADRLDYIVKRLEMLEKEDTHSIMIFVVGRRENMVTVSL